MNFLNNNDLTIKKNINPIIKKHKDNNLENSLNLYPIKITKELDNKNKIIGNILFPLIS